MAATAAAVGLGNATLSEAELLRQLDNLKEYAQTHKNELPGRIYTAMDGISRSALAYLQSKNKHAPKGWATGAVDAAGEALWSPEQIAVLEEAAPIALQVGGAIPSLQFGVGSKFVLPEGTTQPVSIDEMYQSVKDYVAAIDAKNREIASLIGPVAFINGLESDPAIGPLPPFLPVRLQLPARTILPILNSVLETIRILVSNSIVDSSFLRGLSSIVLAIFDVLRGNWKDGVLSLLGVVGKTPMYIGIVMKAALFVYSWISPNIQTQLENDLFAASKSAFIGGWLWLLSTVSPDYVRLSIQSLIDTAKLPLEELNKKIDEIETKTQEVAETAGVQVIFPRVPIEKIPSFDDIQNFQSLLNNPEIYCSQQFQSVLAPAIGIPPLRILLELLNIPTLPLQIQERCKDMPQDITEAVQEAMKPIVLPLPSNSVETQMNTENPEEPEKQSVKGGVRKTRRSRASGRRKSLHVTYDGK